MEVSAKPCVIFHLKVLKDFNTTCSFSGYFEFEPKKEIDFKVPFKLEDKYFSKIKDKLMTYIFLIIGDIKIKFLITLYYDENHITIFKSKKIGVCFEVINQISYDSDKFPLEEISFKDENDDNILVKDYDNIGNKYRRRFLVVNAPSEINLPIKNLNNLKQHLSYKVVVLPKTQIIVYEIKKSEEIIKNDINLDEFKILQNRIENVMNEKQEDKMIEIFNSLQSYKTYFNQILLNKEDFEWKLEEFQAYYFYHAFKLFFHSETEKNDRIRKYYRMAKSVFSKNYEIVLNDFNINIYDKILAIKSLYEMLYYEFINKKNKNLLVGEYTFMDLYNNKNSCYNIAFKFINNFIDNLREDSLIFYPILQANSGKGIDLNSEDNINEIFEISMLNEEMIKRNLKTLIPKFIFIVKHPSINDARGAIIRSTGTIFIYEDNIFHNDIGYNIEDYILKLPNDAAINISFSLLNEIFIHKKFLTDMVSFDNKKTPLKFIGLKFDIKSFFYTNKKIDLDCLAIYTKKKERLKNVPENGEIRRMFEYFFGNEDKIEKPLINILKTYIGLGDLINKVNLVVDRDADKLLDYINKKIQEGNAKPLLKNELLNRKRKRDELIDIIEINNSDYECEEEEEEEEEEEDDCESSLNEEEKYILDEVII